MAAVILLGKHKRQDCAPLIVALYANSVSRELQILGRFFMSKAPQHKSTSLTIFEGCILITWFPSQCQLIVEAAQNNLQQCFPFYLDTKLVIWTIQGMYFIDEHGKDTVGIVIFSTPAGGLSLLWEHPLPIQSL